MTKTLLLGATVAAFAVGAYYMTQMRGDSSSGDGTLSKQGSAIVDVTLPGNLSEQARMGKQAFDAVCADCHGETAGGNTNAGPPLVHKIYEPSHHGDIAFHMAVQNGVRAHHWRFGNMPAQDGLTKADVTAIIGYVRELQRANGIN